MVTLLNRKDFYVPYRRPQTRRVTSYQSDQRLYQARGRILFDRVRRDTGDLYRHGGRGCPAILAGYQYRLGDRRVRDAAAFVHDAYPSGQAFGPRAGNSAAGGAFAAGGRGFGKIGIADRQDRLRW